MKSFLGVSIALLFAAATARAQTDSATVADAKWETVKIAPGIKLKKAWFNKNLFSANQNISILEVKQRKKHPIGLGFSPKELIRTSDFGKREDALAAINGTFFDVRNGGSVDFLRANGEIINRNRLNKNGSRAIHQKAAIVITDGRLDIKEWDGSENWEENLAGTDVMLSGPLMITDGKENTLDSTAFVKLRHPRSAVAVKNNKVYFITVDGRNEKAAGMSLTELRSVMKWLKMDEALNLDGGGSTAMWISGQPDNGVINFPSDNKKWDHAGERKVANVVLVKKRLRR
ncbi:MAG TPA: phosphodiester glycosidase family protein [Sphingobacteriaceae bacterium]